MIKRSVFELSLAEIEQTLIELGEPKFRAKQVWHWIYEKRVVDFQKMSSLSKSLQDKLSENLSCDLPQIAHRFDGADGTTKILLTGETKQVYEAVLMRYDDHTSLCVSSQVGCKLACKFCQTGKLGFFRNLKLWEILGQFIRADEIARAEGRKVTHVVFMGMGEPLDNYKNVLDSCQALTSEDRYNLSSKRVVVSTSGIVPKIYELAKDININLALSLHACNDKLRSDLMPIARRYSLDDLKNSLIFFQQERKQTITLEYILIKDVNSSLEHARELVKFAKSVRSKVNLIPFNAHPGLPYERPSESTIMTFQRYLKKHNVPSPIRYSKGLDISAACGQLAAKVSEDFHQTPQRINVVK
jgi:23S rRNA (adenine2503-C2)-methyltransferase